MAIQRVILTDSRKEDVFYEEAIKTLRTNMQFSGVETKSIVLTSCYPNEGKSDVAFQLAVEIGKMGKRVLIIDADIRKSSYIKRYQIKQKTNGLSQYLSGQVALEEIIYSTNYRNLEIIFSGPYAPNPSELLEQGRFGRLIEETRKVYDYILIDTPPIISMSDAAILVIESEAVSRRDAMKAKEQLTKSGCKLLGAVLNKVDMKKEKYYSKYNSYYYGKSKQE
jgi:capsular exopolysaccharide synthesis family protein